MHVKWLLVRVKRLQIVPAEAMQEVEEGGVVRGKRRWRTERKERGREESKKKKRW